MLHKIVHFLFSADPKVRRQLLYWAGSALFYVIAAVALNLQVRSGSVDPGGARALISFGVGGMALFFFVVRFSLALGIVPRSLAVMQALFAIACTIGAYALLPEVRGALLMIMLVVMVFCTFSLRPRATLGLCATAIVSLGMAMLWLSSHDPATFPRPVELMHFALASCSLLAVTLLTGEMSKLRSRLKAQKQDLMAALGQIRTLATIDELTCLANRRYMNEVLANEERRQNIPKQSMCIALLDIDFFKTVNDRFGHDGGDAVLRTFAATACKQLREADLLARWGGEEFLLMLPDTEVPVALTVLKRMADNVGAIRIPGLDIGRDVTFSAGLVRRRDGEPFAETISRADKAMYAAKASGRNKVVTG